MGTSPRSSQISKSIMAKPKGRMLAWLETTESFLSLSPGPGLSLRDGLQSQSRACQLLASVKPRKTYGQRMVRSERKFEQRQNLLKKQLVPGLRMTFPTAFWFETEKLDALPVLLWHIASSMAYCPVPGCLWLIALSMANCLVDGLLPGS